MRTLSLKSYAAHRRALGLPGTTLRACQDAVAAGRIRLRPDRTIDPATADAAWERNTDAAKRPDGNGHNAEPSNLADARRLESIERARALRLENDVREGRLVPARDVELLWTRRVITMRDQIRGLPSRARSRFDLSPELTRGLAEFLDEALGELADTLTRAAEEDHHADDTRPDHARDPGVLAPPGPNGAGSHGSRGTRPTSAARGANGARRGR